MVTLTNLCTWSLCKFPKRPLEWRLKSEKWKIKKPSSYIVGSFVITFFDGLQPFKLQFNCAFFLRSFVRLSVIGMRTISIPCQPNRKCNGLHLLDEGFSLFVFIALGEYFVYIYKWESLHCCQWYLAFRSKWINKCLK